MNPAPVKAQRAVMSDATAALNDATGEERVRNQKRQCLPEQRQRRSRLAMEAGRAASLTARETLRPRNLS
jgi:hypothetical protein